MNELFGGLITPPSRARTRSYGTRRSGDLKAEILRELERAPHTTLPELRSVLGVPSAQLNGALARLAEEGLISSVKKPTTITTVTRRSLKCYYVKGKA